MSRVLLASTVCSSALLLAACSSPPDPAGDAPPGARAGIGVHGAWTLEVHDPDGSLVQRRAFHNAYVGGVELPQVLAHERALDVWMVQIDQDGAGGPCLSNGQPWLCVLAEPPIDAFPLTVSTVQEGVRLEGNMVAENAADIDLVKTVIGTCAPDGGDCTFASFTEKALDPPLPVQPNQSVYVTVDITFGTLP